MTRTKAVRTIQTLLSLQNGHPATAYSWVNRYSDRQLLEMLAGWQRNEPALFAQHGYYVM